MGFWDAISKLGVGGWVGGGDGASSLDPKRIDMEQVKEPSYYPKLRETLGNRLQGLLDTGPEKYGGPLVAPLSDYQNQSLGKLSEYAAQGTPSVIGEGSREISKTLASEYDPATSAYFQAFRDQRLYDLGESKRRFNEDSASGAGFFHGARVEGNRKLDESATRDITNQNAALAEAERQRRLDVLPQGLAYGQAEANLPLQKIGALQSFGALPQEQTQNEDTAAYNEYLRQLTQGRADISTAAGFAGETPYAYPQYQDSTLMSLIKALAPVAGAALGKKA